MNEVRCLENVHDVLGQDTILKSDSFWIDIILAT